MCSCNYALKAQKEMLSVISQQLRDWADNDHYNEYQRGKSEGFYQASVLIESYIDQISQKVKEAR